MPATAAERGVLLTRDIVGDSAVWFARVLAVSDWVSMSFVSVAGPGRAAASALAPEAAISRSRRVRVAGRPAFGGEPVDREEAHGQDRDRPERIALHERELRERAQARHHDPEPACPLRPGENRERRTDLDDADGQHDPAPRVQVAEDVPCARDVERRLRERDDAVDHAEDAGETEHRAREEEPAGAPLVHLVCLVADRIGLSALRGRDRGPVLRARLSHCGTHDFHLRLSGSAVLQVCGHRIKRIPVLARRARSLRNSLR
jgi:hypothetical protein